MAVVAAAQLTAPAAAASDIDRANVGANTLALTGPIADQKLTTNAAYTSVAAFPAATGADGTVTYSVANLPTGITLNAARKLTGAATTALTQPGCSTKGYISKIVPATAVVKFRKCSDVP